MVPAAALALARQTKCPVVVAKLDRLSRDVAFIAGLMVQRVPFIDRGVRTARNGQRQVSNVRNVLARQSPTL
ncbi:hypothetical protein BQ8794_70544 [Mesorhizobium prunaredense]|uniref:Resolvase/invertase-type recombinase catalytic domain-containing protein n=1 Tax=Mesorhizobium prunaredense TaxID=1631249 RepID=A0A1R3VJZ3_9HYPH|nr:hypothetical protein BQ8794_70544 [Mesorhizobium prunaredense]